MAWTTLVFLILALALGAATIHFGGSARAPDDQMRALLLAAGCSTALVAAIVCAVLAAFG